MTKLIKYTGNSDVRELTSSDLSQLGLDDQPDLTFDQDNNKIAEVDDDVADALLKITPREFASLVEEELAEDDAETPAGSTTADDETVEVQAETQARKTK
jgi:hypothetical protein